MSAVGSEKVDDKKGDSSDMSIHVANTPEMERTFVQDVYDKIADHFSRTRYAVCFFSFFLRLHKYTLYSHVYICVVMI